MGATTAMPHAPNARRRGRYTLHEAGGRYQSSSSSLMTWEAPFGAELDIPTFLLQRPYALVLIPDVRNDNHR